MRTWASRAPFCRRYADGTSGLAAPYAAPAVRHLLECAQFILYFEYHLIRNAPIGLRYLNHGPTVLLVRGYHHWGI